MIRLRAEITVLVVSFALLALAYRAIPPVAASAVIAVSVATFLAVPTSLRAGPDMRKAR